ncbi:MAG: hypothetical protein ABJZ55_10055 [Fuerstiella sp.]
MIGSRSGHFYQPQHDCDGWVAVYVMCWPSEPFISQLNSPESAIFVGGSGDEALLPQLLSGTAFAAAVHRRCCGILLVTVAASPQTVHV